jgi:hypothetical protein
MKKLFLVLTLLALVAGMSYAGSTPIGSVKDFRGNIVLKRGPMQVQVSTGLKLYEGDKLIFSSCVNCDYIVIRDELLTNFPTLTINWADISSSTNTLYWNASTNSLSPFDNGGESTILIVPKD